MIIQIRRPGSEIHITHKQYNIYIKIRVTDTEGVDNEEQAAGGSDAMAPSLIQQPRIVFTGVSGAMMSKMKEVGRALYFVTDNLSDDC